MTGFRDRFPMTLQSAECFTCLISFKFVLNLGQWHVQKTLKSRKVSNLFFQEVVSAKICSVQLCLQAVTLLYSPGRAQFCLPVSDITITNSSGI